MKLKELCYEWVLFWATYLSGHKTNGFYDNKRIYEKKSWLNWNVNKRQDIRK